MSEDIIKRIENLDESLFDYIESQTSTGDRRSLLAVQRATARMHGRYAYLEIGSHLGGSIQPYLVDHRCTVIYSIDPRPDDQPDDRSPEYRSEYPDNSTERMLHLLGGIDAGQTGKIRCFESDASAVDPGEIDTPPLAAFIDGEHTRGAVLSDFAFCERILAPAGTILFHDYYILYETVAEIIKSLKSRRRDFTALKLDGNIFGIFFDPEIVSGDPFLNEWSRRQTRFTILFRAKLLLRAILPGRAHTIARSLLRRNGPQSSK
jgi:hypothetical protein